MQDKRKRFIAILSFVLIMITTFAYSALATNLAITGEAKFRAVADIRVSNINQSEAIGTTQSFDPEFTKDTITAGFNLTSTTSKMSYDVTITNNGEIDQAIYNLITQSSNNSGLSILIDGQPINQALPIIVPFGTSKTITITYSSSTPGIVNVVNKFDFRKVHYITYDLKSGQSTSTDLINGQIKYENVDLKLTEDEPTLSGYDFLGWTDEQNGTTVKFNKGDTYTLDNSDKILYALYKKKGYTITFDSQDGEEPQEKIVQTGDKIGTLPTYQRDGYHFDGWYTGQTDGDKVTSDFEPTKDEIFYAHYTPYKMTINYYAGGATKNGNTTLQNQKLTTDTYDYDGEDLNVNGLKNYDSQTGTWNLIKDGYHADKYWHLGNNASTTKVHEDTKIAKIQDLATTLNKIDDFKTGDIEVNIYAGWTANTYTLHFDKNNTNATGVMSDQTLTYDAPQTDRKINKNIFTYTGHTFVGWNTQANGQGTPYTDEQAINLVTTNNETINLYAQWIANTYTVTYNANGGEVSTPSKQVTYGETYGTLTEPTREGYTFNGWFTDNTYTTEVTSSTPVTITDNQTIIAKWTANNYTVTFDPTTGGTVNPTSKSVTYDQAYGPLPEPSKTGYTFEGWNGKNLFNKNSTPYKTSCVIDPDAVETCNAGEFSIYQVTIKPNTTYTITNSGKSNNPGYAIYNSNGESVLSNNYGNKKIVTFITPATASYIRFTVVTNSNSYRYDKDIFQIEEGSTATTYEPYYVTEDTIVKQAKDHTLTAIYSANELVFNNQTSSVTYNAGSANSIDIVGATNGTGSYTYSKVSESNGTNDTTYFTVSGNKINAAANTPAGTYTVVVKATDDNSGASKDATYTITVNKQKVNVPSCATFTYNKATQTFLSDTDYYTVTNNTGLNAGDYTVKATPTSNYMWSDDTTTTKDIACTINPYNIGTAGNATVSPVVDRVYDASAYEPTPSVTVPLPTSTNPYTLTDSDLTYSYTTDHTNVGEKQVTITGKGNYTGTINKSYNITKANGFVTLNKIEENVEFGTTSTTFKVLTNSGNLSVNDNNATATVSITGDTVTVSDISTLSAGTTVVVTVTSASNTNYKEATATYTLNITNKPLTGGSVKITGNNIVGNTLTASVTDTTPKADSYTYKWYREGSNTPIATTNTYQVTSDDIGKSLRVVVSATKDNYESTSFEDTTDVTNNKTEIVKTGVTKPTAANYCKSLTYNGESQVLTNAAATGYAFYDNSGIAATSYTVTAKLSDDYIWSNGDTADVTFNCSIAKKDVTVKADNQSKEYDGTALTANTSCTATGLVATHTPSCITSGTITDYAASGAVKTLSSAKIMDGSTDVSSNYNITLQNGTLTITKKAITITAKPQTVQYGTAISKTTSDVTVATLPSTDTLNSITLSQSKTAVSTDGKITATAAVIKRGTTDTTNNYTITYNQGNLTINKKNITASISSCSNKVYDGNTTASCGITLSGVQTGETATATATCNFSNKNVGTSKEITCNTFVLDGTNKGNYNITTTSLTGSANITAKSITPTATASNKTYDGTDTATCTISLPGVVSGDTVSSTYTGTFNNKNVGTSKAVTCSDITLTGTDKDNYSLSKTSLSTTANVTAKSVAVSWTNVGPFTYNGSNQGPTATVNTGITGETMTVTATKAINKGTHTSTASCSSVTGSSACGNYTLTNTTKEFTINAQTVNPVTNLTVNTSGVVSWTASSNATGYQISIDGTTWTDMPSSQTSYNYLNVLTATSANKTVYVRAINTDADNYSTVDTGSSYAHSSNATSAVTIRTLTVSSNNTNYGTVNNTSFNVINGTTYSTSSNVLTLSDGRKSTATKIDAVGYTTTFSSWSPASGTINANTTVTANFTRTANSYTVTANSNGGGITSTTGWTGTGNTSTKSVTYDATYGTLPTVSRTGYTFDGWYKPDYSTAVYKEVLASTVLRLSPFSAYTSSTINFEKGDVVEFDIDVVGTTISSADLNDVSISGLYTITGGTNIKGRVVINDSMAAIHGSLYYNFLDINNNGIPTSYTINKLTLTKFDTEVTSSSTVNIASDHSIEAKWTPVTYNITYDLRDGSVSTANPSTYNIETETFTLNNPTRSGYTFDGWSQLPSGYKQVEYIQSDGSQFIDTGVTADSTTIFNIVASTSGVEGHTGLFGARNTDYSNSFLSYIENNYGGNTNIIRVDVSPNVGGLTGEKWTKDEPFTIDINTISKKLTVNSTISSNNLTYPTSNDITIGLFANHQVNSYIYPIAGRIYRNYIYKNNVLVRDFIPCINSNGEVGLYDLVNNQFYTNISSSTTPFVAGPANVTIFKGAMGDKSFTANWSKAASNLTVTLSQDSYTYNGGANTPTVTVKDGTTTIPSTEYDVTYSNNTNAGTATATITMKGNYYSTTKATYTGSTTKNFTINKKTLTITAANKSMTYGGSAPTYSYTSSGAVSGESPISGTATYTIKDSSNNTVSNVTTASAGTYTIVPSGLTINSNYSANYVNGTLTINKASNTITLNCGTLTYNKASQNLIASKSATGGDVYIGLESLTASNYTTKGSTALTGARATNAGSYTVYAYTPGNANYNATSTSKSCSIAKYNISSATVSTIPDHTYDNTVYKPTPSVTVPLPNSTTTYTLTDSEYDYSYSVASPKDVATYTVTMTAKADTSTFTNNYTGSVSKTYKIVQANGYVNLSATTGSVTYGTASKTFTVSSSHGGTLSVSDDNTTATSAISNGTVTIGSLGSLASGTKVKVTVTSAATTNYKEASATYELTITNAAIDCGTVAITGNNVVGEKLTASTTSTPSDVTKTYQWYTNTSDSVSGGTAISGATSSSFTLTSSQVGKYIYATITCSKTNYTTASASGKATTTSNKTATTKTKVAKPTAATYCANPTYNGSSQVITNTAATGYAFSNNSATNYSSTGYDVTAALSTNYIWSDYTTANTSINCNITRRNVTYKADDQSKTYDSTALNANTNCTLTDGTLVSGHSATCATSGSQTNAGSSTKTLSSVTIMNGSTNVTANYNITKTNGTLTVNKSIPTGTIEVISTTTSSVTIKETTDTSYNMNHWQYKVGSGSWVNFSYEAATSQTYTITGLTAGSTYTIYADFRDTANTNWASPKPSVSVTLPRISIDVPTGSNFTYDGKSHTGVSSGTGYTLTGDITKIDAGNYTATAKLDSQHKWSDGTTADKTISWSITPKTLSVTADAKSKTYGNANPTLTYTVGSAVGSETPAFTGALATSATASSNVGNYNITQGTLALADGTNGFKASNYSISYTKGTLTINRATVAFPTCSAKTYTGSEQTLFDAHTSGSYTNSVLKGTNATTSTNTYTVNLTPTANYQWSSGSNVTSARTLTCTINPKQLDQSKFTVSNNSKTYDGNTNVKSGFALTANTTSGLVSGDSVTVSYTSAAYNVKTTSATTINVSGISINNSNYSLKTTSQGYTGSITAKALTPTVSASNKTYNGNTDATCSSSVSLAGVVSGDTVTASANTSGTFDNKNVGTGKTVTCSGITLAGTDKGNYSVASSKTTTANITAKALTITAANKSMTYGASAPSYSYTVSGAVSGESPVSGTATYTIKSGSTTISNVSTANVGSYTIVPSGLTINSNYTASYSNGTLTISNASFSGGSVAITGTNIIGSTLTASVTAPTPTPTSYTYQWYRGDTAISGATNSTYTVAAADLNSIIKVKVTAKKTNYSDYSPSGFTVATTAASNGTQKAAYRYTATTQKNVSSATGNNTSVSCYAYTSTGGCSITLPANPYTLSNYTFIGWVNAGTATTSTSTSGTAASGSMTISSNVNIVAIWRNTNYNTQYTATYWYNNNSNSGSITLTSTQKSCNIAASYNGATIPTTCSVSVEGRSSVGKYNSAYGGYASSLSSLTRSIAASTTSINLSANATYYAVYSSPITIYYQNSSAAIASSNTALYRNEYMTSTSAMTTLTATSNTGTTQATEVSLSNVRGSMLGINSSANSTTSYAINTSSYINSNTTTFYAISTYTSTVTATFYYSKAAAGTVASVTASGKQTRYAYCTSSTAVSNTLASNVAISPTLSPAEVAPTGTAALGWSTSTTSMSTTSPTTANTAYYRVYRQALTIYYPTGTSSTNITSKNNAIYRNAFMTASNATTYTTRVVNGSTGTTQLANSGVTSSVLASMYGTFTGLATSVNTTTKYDINNASKVVNSATKTYYAVNTYRTSVSVTFYYSKAAAGTVASKTASGTQTRNLYCSSTTAVTSNVNSNGAISPSLSEVAPTGTAALGWSKSTTSMSTASATTANTAYYRVYSQALTIYYPTSTSEVTSKNNAIYRNAFMTSSTATTFTTRVVNGSTGTTQLTNSGVTSSVLTDMYGTFAGLATSANTTTKYAIDNAANVVNNATTTYYMVNTYTENIQAMFYYSSGIVGTKKGTVAIGTRTNNVYCSSTSSATTSINSEGSISPTVNGEVAPQGTTAIGWSTGMTSMTTTSPTTATQTYYRVYRGNVTNYFWNGSIYSTKIIYRNSVYNTSSTRYASYLSTSTTGLTNLTPEKGQNSKAWVGYATSNGGGVVYSTVAAAAYSDAMTLYSVYALDAVDVYYDNTNTGMTCETVQCALDNIGRMLTRAGAKTSGNDYLCKKATSLHATGYGQLPTTFGTAGNAYICDVNGDKTYNATNEMFYYVSDYFDNTERKYDNKYATLVYYNNVSAGSPNYSSTFAYDSAGSNLYGPRTAVAQLPDTTLWKNAGLFKNSRKFIRQGSVSSLVSTGGDAIFIVNDNPFSYKGYAARLLMLGELASGCPGASTTTGSLNSCKYLMENTYYQNRTYSSGYWLETPNSSDNSTVWYVNGYDRYLSRSSSDFGVRPAIDVRKCDIEGSGVNSCD